MHAGQESIDTAAEHADPAWLAAAREEVQRLAGMRVLFTTDDVWAALAERGVTTHEPRALGSVMQAARRAKLIVPVGYRSSSRPECHGRPVRTWGAR